MDRSIAGDLWVLLFTSRDHGEGKDGTAVKRLAQTLAHVSIRSPTGGIVAPGREAAANPCAGPDLRQRSPGKHEVPARAA